MRTIYKWWIENNHESNIFFPSKGCINIWFLIYLFAYQEGCGVYSLIFAFCDFSTGFSWVFFYSNTRLFFLFNFYCKNLFLPVFLNYVFCFLIYLGVKGIVFIGFFYLTIDIFSCFYYEKGLFYSWSIILSSFSIFSDFFTPD